MGLSIWAFAVFAFAAVALGTLAVVLLMETVAAARRRRNVLDRIESALEPVDAGPEGGPQLFRDPRRRRGPTTALEDLPHLKDVGFLLEQAGVNWTVQGYLFGVVGLALAFGLAALLVSGSLLVALAFAAGGSTLPFLYIRRKRTQRLNRFEELFPEAIDLMGRAIRAGHPLSAGIRMVADEAGEPVGGEFRQVFEEQRFGLAFEEALLGLTDRVALVDVRILITAILIQREVGGNLAEILDKIAQTIRARFAIRRQLRVYTAQGRLSGYVLAAMPLVMAFLIFLMDRSYVAMLIEDPVGRFMVVVAVVMQIIGYLWIRKIVNIEI